MHYILHTLLLHSQLNFRSTNVYETVEAGIKDSCYNMHGQQGTMRSSPYPGRAPTSTCLIQVLVCGTALENLTNSPVSIACLVLTTE